MTGLLGAFLAATTSFGATRKPMCPVAAGVNLSVSPSRLSVPLTPFRGFEVGVIAHTVRASGMVPIEPFSPDAYL